MSTYHKILLGIVCYTLWYLPLQAQVEVPFTPRLDNSYINIKGDYTFLSNGILNRVDASNTANDPYNDTSNNNGFHRDYIDVDSDPTTFSSSSSTLTLPYCSRIYYAGLYWSANYQQEVLNNTAIAGLPANDAQRLDFTAIKFKVPGGSYVDLVADNDPDLPGEEDEIIHDDVNFKDSPYTCYKNVTSLLQSLANPEGEYFVANVRATRGVSVGGAGGWTLVVIYENPTLTGKYISTFDGYAGVRGSSEADITVSGFNTIPSGPVRARLGASVVEGDRGITGDAFLIETPLNPGFTNLSNASNPSDNFFNSNITIDGADVTTRNIASTNTLGYDADIFEIDNPSNSIIANQETDATLRLYTEGDSFGAFLVAFGVEIIEPKIILEKTVEDLSGTDITGAGVNLGQHLEYILSFKNTGNDHATNYTIRDILPINVTLDESAINLPPGVNYVYNQNAREIIFTIPDNLVEIDDPFSEIRLPVQVASNCFDFVDACTENIENVAYSTYQGVINDNQITDDPSVSDFDNCGFTTPGATNFLLDNLAACSFTRTVQLCGGNAILDAGDNYDGYTWYRDVNENYTIDASDTVITDGDPDNDPSTLNVNTVGVYIVDKEVADPCIDFQEYIEVVPFGANLNNPIVELINDTSNTVDGAVLICPNDGEELPEIFLCGLNDTELIQINIPDAQAITWQQLDDSSCAAATANCANKNGTCTWNTIDTGNDFLAQDSGEYKVVVDYLNGCFTQFYFNIYKNPLDPAYNSTDIICSNSGEITVTNVPINYEFELVDANTNTIIQAFQTSPTFSITNSGIYTVNIRQQGVTGGCEFVLDNIGIRERDFEVQVLTKDTDCNGLGELSISVLDVEPQYTYELLQGGISIDTFGPSIDNNHTFANLHDGTYEINVTTQDGCSFTNTYTINDVSNLALSALVTKNIDCLDGSITVTGTGGYVNPDYFYAIYNYNGADLYATLNDIPASAYQTHNTFDFSAADAGTYQFVVVDSNNCVAFSNTVEIVVQPSVAYTTTIVNESCFGAQDGSYTVNVTNNNGYSVSFTLLHPDGTLSNNTSGVFTNLTSGGYAISITQTQGAISCDFLETFSIGGPTQPITANAVLVQNYTCTQQAIIEAQNVDGGTPPYEYAIDGVTFVSGFGSERFSNLTNGDYQITIRDTNGCIFTTNTVTVPNFTPPSDLDFTSTPPTCANNTSNVTVNITNGQAPFIVEITSPSNIAASNITGATATFNNLTADTYTFRVTDANNCTYEENYTTYPVSPISLTAHLDNNVTCFTNADGAFTLITNNFYSSYNYSITGPSNFSGNNETNGTLGFINLGQGTYNISVTDVTSGCVANTSITVSQPAAALTLNADVTQLTCLTNGSVNLTATGGWGGNTFSLTNPDGTTFGTNNTGIFTNLLQTGSYTASVTDTNNCTVSTPFSINPISNPSLNIVPNSICYVNAVGLSLTAQVTSGGDGNFEYSLNGGAYTTNNTFTGLNAGTYTIDVRDGNGCTDTASITINNELTLTANALNISACGSSTIVNINASGGDGAYVYAVVLDGVTPVASDFVTSNTITVNATGNYDVYVRDKTGGANYCEISGNITIGQDAPLNLTASATNVLCGGDATGTITLTASGGMAPYSFSNDGGTTFQTSNTFNNLTAANYFVVIRDQQGCTISQTISIAETIGLSASAAVTQLAECNTAGAEVRITNAIGGTPPYEYSFDGGLSYVTSHITNLLPGTYSLFLRDANNCSYAMSVTVNPAPAAPPVSTSQIYECDGEAVVTVTTTDTDYDYTFELNGTPNSPNTSNIFNDVPVGNHTLTVNYTDNTPQVPSMLLNETFGQGANTPIAEIDPTYCYEPQDGSASACPGYGSNAHIQDGEYSVTSVIASPFGAWLSPQDHTGLTNGRFLAINVNGSAGVGGVLYNKTNVEVIPNTDITVSLWAFNLLVNGSTGYDPSIEIELVDTSGAIIASTTTGIIPKNTSDTDWHDYEVTLNPGANTTLDIVIRTNITAGNGNDIAIDDIQAFQYPIICEQSLDLPITVDSGYAFNAAISNFNNITCFGGNDGSISFTAENFGASGFEYSLDNFTTILGTSTSTAAINLPNLSAGNYNLSVRDAANPILGCTVTLNQVLSQPAAVSLTPVITEPLTCVNGGATVTVSATGGTPNYIYELRDNSGFLIVGYDFATNGTNNVFNNLGAGGYQVLAQDANGCTNPTTTNFTITNPANIAFNATPTACYSGANNGSIAINVTAGNGNYLFSLNGGPFVAPTPSTSTNHTFNNLSTGNYTIDVMDQYGCTAVQQTVTINTPLTATAALNNDLTCLANANITINATGGVSPYSYEWSNNGGTTFNTTNLSGNVFTTNTFGDYIFRVTDSSSPSNCTTTTNTVTVTEAQTPIINSITANPLLCNGDTNGVLNINIDYTVGLAPFTIEVVETVSSTNYGNQINNLPAGNYQVTITDAKGCVSNPYNIAISQPNALAYSVNLVPITCTGGGAISAGSITVENVTGGTAEYTYYLTGNNGYTAQYSTTAGGEDHTFSILEFGIYEVDVVDANGCSLLTTNIIASPPSDLDIDVSTLTASCAAGGTAIISVSSSVGSGDYEFAILETFTSPYSTTYYSPDVPMGDTRTFTGLTPGITYTFVVYDNVTNCYYFEEAAAPIDTPSAITSSIDAVANVTCTGAADGNVSFSFDNYNIGATAVTYEVFHAQSNISTGITGTQNVNPPTGAINVTNVGPLDQGVYYILLTEVNGAFNGCTAGTVDFTITEASNLLQVTATATANDNCNVNAGTITAVGQFGTPPYEYQYLLSTDPAPTASSSGWVNNTAVNVEAGNYIVYIKDANNCVQQNAVTVNVDPDPSIALAIVDPCVAEGSFEVTVTLINPAVAIAPFSLSVNGAATQNITFNASNQYTVTGLSSGALQSFVLFDANGCSVTQNITITPPLQFTALLSKVLDCSASPNATIDISALQGSGTYDYAVDGPGAADQARTSLGGTNLTWAGASAAGNYDITLFDNTTNCSQTLTVNVPTAQVPTISVLNITPVSCIGANDGSITVSTTDIGVGPYNFEIISGVGSSFSFPISPSNSTATTATFNNLEGSATGISYAIRVTAAVGGCTSTTAAGIIEPNAISNINTTIVPFGCTAGNNVNNASITVQNGITGGTGTYVIYEFIEEDDPNTAAVEAANVVQYGNNPTFFETDIVGGVYTINVYDSNGCLGSTTATINPFDEFTATSAVINSSSCVNGESITITGTSLYTNSTANSNYQFRILPSGTYQNNGTFTNLAVGTHNFEVLNTATGCIRTHTHTVANPNVATISLNVTNNVQCFGTSTGAISFELVNPTYTNGINWRILNTQFTPTNFTDDTVVATGSFASKGPVSYSGLAAGEYYVEITQQAAPECTSTEAFQISSPNTGITAVPVITAISCLPGNDGVIEITNVQGGWGGYSYYVSQTANPNPFNAANYSTNARFENLTAGTYEVWVIDQQGCPTQLANQILNVPTAISASLSITNPNCTNIEGAIEVSPPTGGQGSNYTYQLYRNTIMVGNVQTSRTFSGLSAGSYMVLVSDQLNCTFTTNNIVLYDEIVANTTIDKPIDCSVNPGGHISINPTGGSGTFDFSVTFPDGSTPLANINSANTATFTNLTQNGTYSFTITDTATGHTCSKTVSALLDNPQTPILATSTLTNISCNGGSDGSITVNLDPSTVNNPPYQYELIGISGAPSAALQNSNIFNNLPAGQYQIRVVSNRGCDSTATVTLTQPSALTASASGTSFVCNLNNTVNTATITITAAQGTAPYLYSIDGINYQTSNTFEVVDTGSVQNITTFVQDANACNATANVVLEPINIFTVTVNQINPLSCTNDEVVQVTVNDNGNPLNNYTYQLLPLGSTHGSLQATPTNVTANFNLLYNGDYVFRVTDNTTGCYVDSAPYSIAPINNAIVTAVPIVSPICFGSTDGTIEVTINNYNGNYNYVVYNSFGVSTGLTGTLNTSVNPISINGMAGGNYYVEIAQLDYPYCTIYSNTVTIVSPDRPLITTPFEAANVSCDNNNGEIEISPEGGYPPYNIVLTNTTTGDVYSANSVPSMVFTNLTAGVFSAEITDSNNCSIIQPITLTRPAYISADIAANPSVLSCYGDNNGQVQAINVVGGQGTYQYQLNTYDNGNNLISTSGYQNSNTFNNLGAGVYSILVSDGWNCGIETALITISEPNEIIATVAQQSPLSCNNQAQIVIEANGGSLPYQYSSNGVTFLPMSGGNSHTLSVGVGNYQFYVQDANGCISSLSNEVTIDPLQPLTVNLDLSAAVINCAGDSSATIIANTTGALGDYRYELYADAALTTFIQGPQTSNTFDNLPSGNYFIHVTSADCQETVQATITEPDALQIIREDFENISCFGAQDGSINVEVTGGVGQIYYAISPNLDQFDTVNSFTHLTAGDYNVIAQDQNGCFIPFEFTITEPTTIQVTPFNLLGETCLGNNDGIFELDITGGTPPYRTALDSNADSDFVQDQLYFNNVSPGLHVVFIKDAQDCQTTQIIEINSGVNLNASVIPIYTCNGNIPENGLQVIFEDPTIVNNVLYALDTSDEASMRLESNFENILPGSHYLTVAHTNGCLIQVPFEINNYQPLTITLEQSNLNEITATAQGGVQDYTFYFNEEQTNQENVYRISATDTYTVRVVDQNGCEAVASIDMEYIDLGIPDFFTPDGDEMNQTWAPQNIEAFPNVLTIIYDRYGRELYRMERNDDPWNGLYQGNQLPTGDYWYVIRLREENDDREFIGHFTLYR